MNPFRFVRSQFYPDHDGFGETAAACLVLRILEANYTGGFEGGNAFGYVLGQLAPYSNNDFVKKLQADWNSRM